MDGEKEKQQIDELLPPYITLVGYLNGSTLRLVDDPSMGLKIKGLIGYNLLVAVTLDSEDRVVKMIEIGEG